jgi:hypothetical protein
MTEVFCGECLHYRGTERVPDAKSTSWMDASRPKCVIGKSAGKRDFHCGSYTPDGCLYSDGTRQKRHKRVIENE